MVKATEILRFDEAGETICDVVFLHGLDGDIQKTWTYENAVPGDTWPHWVAKALPQAAVWSVGYDAASSKWFGHGMPIIDRAINLLRLMEINGIGKRPVAFIAHSMGGLIIKQMLRHAADYGVREWDDFKRNVAAIIFVATPHHGSAIPGYLDAINIVFRPAASTKDLHTNDRALFDLNTWFRQFVHLNGTTVASFHEERPTAGCMVVDLISADLGLPGIISTGIDANHIDICKPAKSSDLVAEVTLLKLLGLVTRAHESPSIKRQSVAKELSFRVTTEINEDNLDDILSSSEPCDIRYSEDVTRIVSLLSSYNANPTQFLNKLPYLRNERDSKKREEAAASYHSGIHEIDRSVQKIILENRDDLSQFRARLRKDGVDKELSRRALKSFGSFAALRLIRPLKRFYDVDDGKPVIHFESFAFNRDPSYCYLDWAPRKSFTGKRVFDYYYYVGARIGPSGHQYEYVMLPLDVARRLFHDYVRGDSETFYVWILPQLFLVGCHGVIENYSAASWEIILLQGGQGEWQGPIQEDPWKTLHN